MKINEEFFQLKQSKLNSESNLKYFGIGFYIISPTIIGLFFGFLTNKIVFFIFLGSFLSLYNLFKLIKTN
jgi:hypothetical protein